jgi:predicted RNA-binding protein
MTEPLCKPCHKQIHELITEKDMALRFNTIEDLKAHPAVAKWIEWVKDKTF